MSTEYAGSLQTESMKTESGGMFKAPVVKPLIEPDSGWQKPFGQRHVPGYGGHVPDVTDHGTGMSFSEATHRLVGNYPNKLNAPQGVGRPERWSSVAMHDYVSHTGQTRHKWNDGMGTAGETSDRGAIGAPVGSDALIKTLHPHQDKIVMKNPDGIDRDAPCRRAGAQTLLGPSDTPSDREKFNHTFVNQMTFATISLQHVEDQKAAAPIASKKLWPELVGMDGAAAKKVIQREAGPKTKIELIPRGSMISEDVKKNRVRIFVHADTNKVAVPPRLA
eukprot:gene22290-29787_t